MTGDVASPALPLKLWHLDCIFLCCQDASMRTTVTLDPDVERSLKEKSRRTRQSFKQVLNDAIRRGLREAPGVARKPFRVKARSMNLRAGIDPARLTEIDDALEVDGFLDATKRLLGRKSS